MHDLHPVVRFVIDHYIAGREAEAARRVGERLKVSAATVKRACDRAEEAGILRRVDVIIDVRESNYNTVRCERAVSGWVPTRRYLANLLRGIKEEKR